MGLLSSWTLRAASRAWLLTPFVLPGVLDPVDDAVVGAALGSALARP
jgi:hypothetical protein